MTAKKVESFRQREGTNKIVRILHTKPILDGRWLNGISREVLKKYLVLKYSKDNDKWLPIWNYSTGIKVQWWDSNTHESLKSKISGYDTDNWSRQKKDESKLIQCSKEMKLADYEYFHTDDWDVAQEKYIQWCKEEGATVSKLTLGKDHGDD